MRRSLVLLLSAATLIFLNISVTARSQSNPPPPNYKSSPPPCQAVTPSPVRGAARGAAGGPLSERFPGMPGAALLSGQPSVGFAVQYVEARPAVRVPVTENPRGHGGSDEKILRGGSAGMLSRRMHAAFCSTTPTGRHAAHTATRGGSTAPAASHLRSPDRARTMGRRPGAVLGPARCGG